jgi:hypothetical protein
VSLPFPEKAGSRVQWQPLRVTYRGCLVYARRGDFAWEDVDHLVTLPEPIMRFLRSLDQEGNVIELSLLEEKLVG